MAVTSTEFGYIPFTKVTHSSIILSHLLLAWRNQYNLTHKTVPELPCAILQDLENIERLFIEKYNKKARANKAKAATASKAAERMPKKRAHEGSSSEGAPKKGRSVKYYKWCNAADWPFTTHDTIECRRFAKDGSPKDKPAKPFDAAKKPWKKTGSRDSSQMAYLTEKLAKLKKKLKKSKKHGKKRARDSLDTDSDSAQDNGSSSTGSLVDKHLKLEQPLGIDLISTDTRPIKATKLALDVIRANEIAIENSKTSKVTAVVAILKVFGDKIDNSRSATPGKLLIKPNKWLNLKKKNLNRSKKHLKGFHKPFNNASKRLLVKQKTIRVLLDTGSSGDLLFIRKGSQKYIPTMKRAVPQSTVMGHFKRHLSNKKGGCD